MDTAITPSPGRIVEYTLDDQDVARIEAGRKEHGVSGNFVTAGDTYPMVIIRVWGSTPESSVNGQVLLDGPDGLWVTSVAQGDGPRKWRVFPRV